MACESLGVERYYVVGRIRFQSWISQQQFQAPKRRQEMASASVAHPAGIGHAVTILGRRGSIGDDR